MSWPALEAEVRFATLAGMLRARAAERPDQPAFTFLTDGEAEAGRLTYAELDRKAAVIAAALRESAAPGERALLLYPAGLELIAAFFGCLYAGVVAVPAYPPRSNDRSQSRLRAIARDAEPRVVLTTADVAAHVEGPRGLLAVAPELAAVRWLPTDLLDGAAPVAPHPEPDPQALAFLQYTSGSTADPKGVMVTHANLLHNERMIGAAFGMDEESVVVGWLPLYHDMGLIGNVLQPLHAGGQCVLMSPVSFLQRPMRWLEAISRYRATTSGGPNFAYELCLRKVDPEALAGLDLASWRVAFNGAEPVRASTLERFAETFAPAGFHPEAFYPCYGLAEATLFVTGGERGSWPRVSGSRVSCGHAWMGQRLAVADPETGMELPAGMEGEIWVAGPSVARGYWKNAEATALDFNAFLETGEGPFLRTGDLGVLDGGELYVTGRIKDLIILRGRNLYPQDVELTAERSHPDLRPGNGAAFSVEVAGEERLVVVHEVERRRREGFEEVAEAVRRAVAEEHEAQVHEVVLIRTGGLPKTSSGKVQRGLCRRLYLTEGLPVISRSALSAANPAAETALELSRSGLAALEPGERRSMLAAWLGERTAAVLGVPAVSPEQPLTGLGLDSLTAVELKGSVEAALGLPLPLAELLRGAGTAELADLMLAGLDAEPAVEAPPRALSLEGDQPLSPGQRALWFLERLAPEAGAYNVAVAARVREGLDVDALRRALAALAERHEALRTVIRSVDGEPWQRAVAGLEPDVTVVAAAGWSDRELRGRLEAEAWRPFDLEAGSPLRVRVYERAGEERMLLVAVHHLVCDFWSLAVAARELAALYIQETGGPRAELEPPGLRYSDFVHWQARLLEGPRGEELRKGWRETLAGVRDLDLPVDHPRPPVQTWRGGSRALRLSPELTAGARSLATSRGATLFVVLLTAFEAQLGRTARQDDFAVGTPTSGRGVPELAGVMGYFVNPVALRADLSGEPTFQRLLDRVRRTALAGLERAEVPFPWVAADLRPVRDPARPPVFQVTFALQQGRPQDDPGLASFALGEEGGRLVLGGLTLESVRLRERRAQFELSLGAAELPGGGLLLSLEHNADLFDPATAERMLGRFRTLLTAAVADPAAPVHHLPWLDEAERLQVLEWSLAPAVTEPRGTLHELVFAQAERAPAVTALAWEGGTLTYGELAAWARRLAGALRDLGVGRETVVGVFAERSPEQVAGTLGVLAAGGAWTPLDPTYPRARLEAMIEDSGAPVILAQRRLLEEMPSPGAAKVLVLEDALAAPETAGGLLEVDGRQLAYVFFTSGSTGRPKGVAVPHRAVVNRLLQGVEVLGVGPGDVNLQRSPLGFDPSILETFGSLIAGGKVVLPRPGGQRDPVYMAHLAAEHRITLLEVIPSILDVLLDQDIGEDWAASVRYVLPGAEVLTSALADRALKRIGAPVINQYGPTEAAIDLIWHWYRPGQDGPTVPIGRPIAGTAAYVLDPFLSPVPAGVPGELWLGGIALARGYLGRPDLTADAFRPDPFGGGERLYRTGDLARWLPDGNLEFLGRADEQVKIRGIRVEPGEAEAALRGVPGVREAAVVPVKDSRGARLVAFLAADPAPDVRALRAALEASLPEAFIPSAFVIVPELPRTPSGKVDRRALTLMAPEPAATEGTYAAPRTPAEELLAGIWAGLLDVPRVGLHDDFFELGGHSLLATRVVSRISRVLGVDLPVGEVFAHPTLEGLAARIAGAVSAPMPPVRPVPREPGQPLPASWAQRRLVFLDLLERGSAAYNLPGWLRLTGGLDVPALAGALTEIARRHEVLRSVLRIEGGEPVQVAGPPRPVRLPVADLSGLPDGRRLPEAERLAAAEAAMPFDLGRGPLVRHLLLRLAPADHVLAVTLHHTVTDGWSLGILFAELADLYEAGITGGPSPLPELSVQYGDYAVWQRERLRGDFLDSQLDWWRQRLADAPVLELPADHTRPADRSVRGGVRQAALPADLAAGVETLARREGATPFMVLLAAFQAQLARYTGAASVPVGAPVANRGRVELEGLIGFFANTLVLHTRLGDDPAARELLARVREVSLGAWAHQEVPFERLVEELRPERRRDRNPLFQVAFQVEEPLPVRSLGDLAAEVRRLDTGTAKFDLTLSVTREPDGFAAALEYDAGRFDPATADRFLGHWRTLVEGIVAEPEVRVTDLPLLTGAEAAQIVGWTGGIGEYPREATIHGLFEEQARRAPDAVALETASLRLTYGELDALSNRLARRLRRLGVGPEVPVGLCLRRSPELIVAMLGTLKAGGAYVPLDPAYPAERLALLAEETGLSVAVLLAGTRPALPPGVEIIEMAEGGELTGEPENAGPLPELARPKGLAYIVFTSGSTGRSKGVEAVHRAVVRLVRDTDYAPFGPDEVFLHLATPSFDAATYEVWGALLNGARLVVLPGGTPSLAELAAVLSRHGVTSIFLTTGLFHQMVELRLNGLRGLRTLLAGGDVLSPEHARRAVEGLPGCTVVNIYGPTENTAFSTHLQLRSAADVVSPLPIGRPIAHSTVHILDDAFRPVPVGVPGELCTGGDGLARGYRGRPDLTAERFVPAAGGERLYRTGDLARWRPDGAVEFLGRRDQQVKIRGFRVEPGEIEAVLTAHPGIADAVVIPRQEPGGKTLAAYVVPRGADLPAGLREHLRESLPEYMIPTYLVALPELPLNASGKVDRKALAALGVRTEAAPDYEPPRNGLEARLAEVWGEVLEVERVGIRDDFFALGGHSLLAIRLLSRVEDAVGVGLPVSALFESPTVAGMAERIGRPHPLTRLIPPEPDPSLPPSPGEGEQPLSFAQRRLWFLDKLEPGSAEYNVPIAVKLEGDLDVDALKRALAEIVRRHEPLRTVYAQGEDGEPVQVILPPSSAPVLERVKAGREALNVVAAEPFDLERGPVARFLLFETGEREWILLASFHHIAVDGWSLEVFFRELAVLYGDYAAGREPSLPEPVLRYADWAARQRRTPVGSLDFWRRRLAGVPVLDLPTDRPRPPRRSVAGGMRRFDVEPGTAEAIRALARAEGASPFMVLLAGFAAFLRRLSGQDDFAVGVPVAGRDRRETEELIGLFVNTLAVHVDLSAGLTFRELVRRVRDEVLAAQAHQEVPFERLVEELQPERTGDRPPLVQVLFAFMSAAGREPVRMEGLTLSLEEADAGTAKFDLTVSALERDGRLFGWLEHRTDLFDPSTAVRLAERYTVLLAMGAAAPDRLLADLAPLGAAQRHQLLVEWNDAWQDASEAPLAIRLFEVRAARTPEALALAVAGERLTYSDLDRRADRLARRLRRLGVGPEARVGLLLERSADFVVAILAVWKAGGAYVPLSPALPRERLDWMAADAGLAAVIAEEEPGWGVPLVHPGEGEDGGDLPAVEPGHLAYLIYTSGTTGRPKAVLVEHGNLSHTLRAAQLRFGFNEEDRTLHLASFSFDISLFELLAPLLAGGTVELLTSAEILDLPDLAARVLGATRVHAVPSLTRQILDQLEGEQEGPRTIFSGGDRVPPDLLRDLRRTFPESEVVVLYGPTEATVICSAEPLDGAVEERTVIGRPLPGCSLRVTDRDGNPAPIGVPGELLVGGPGVTRGYLGRPDLTGEKYVPGVEGRLYRTGDLARWLPDGRIEFLGRVDTQIKIRGFRVEPGEIEALLRAQGGVRDAVVVVREKGQRLTAYVVPEGGTPEGFFAGLRSALEERLPDYMIPAAWMALPELPLTPHGKVDRRALPEPEEEPRRTTPPRTLIEEVLCSLWAEVLGVERVGVHDGFFDLGGHSLLATQLVSRLRRDLGVEIPLAALFEGPTVAALAPKVEATLRGEAEAAPPIVRYQREERPAPLPLSFAQERLWFLDRLEPGPLYNIPAAARLTGPLHPPALAAALGEITRRHETLRTRFVEKDRRPVQEILPWAPAALPVMDLSGLPEERRRKAVMEEAAIEALLPFDLAAGRPLRTVLARLDPEEHVLLLTVHHIAADGWSMGVLLAELSALYEAALAGGPSPLPELPVQYADFALWQREWLRGRRLERELEYWRVALEGAPEALDLPTDRPRQSQGTPRGGSRPFRIGREAWEALTALTRSRGWTPFMLLLAAFEELLARYSHQRDVVVGSPIANRHRAEIEGLIGFFANTLVLRMDLGGDPTFADLVDRARTMTLEAYAHQNLPFEKLVEDLAPRREAGRTPLFQVMLALQNAPLRLELPGLELEVLELESATAKFDLVLALVEAEEALSGGMEYDRSLFDETTIDRLLNHLGTFLQAAVGAPDVHLSSLGMLTAAERHQLAAWSRPPREYREGWCVHQRVAARAALNPDAEAVVFGDESLTYGDFLRRARRLAFRLRELGVGPDVPVGIFLERSLDLPVAILAVLEAGGAYLPLDPGYPRERLRLMLEDAHAPVVLTQESLLGALPSGASQPLLVREIAGGDGQVPNGPLVVVDPENLVYLIYTSGSTGRPKGVAMTHAAISAMLDWQLRTSAAGGGRTLQFAALSFDVSFQEMFSAWCAGGAVVMVSEDVRRDPPALLRLLEEARVERLFLPFVALQQLALAARVGEAPSSLREVMSAGEQLYVTPQVAALFAALPGAELHNHYGPSETHAATWLGLTGTPGSWPERPSVGIPLDHARIFLLDLELQPVPAGVPGEIFIGGRGLARGYLGRPRMTAERFVPDPFADVEGWESGSRMYRTGDLARWLPDGNVEYLGRGDHQVKIRGQRIELGEVETALARHPALSQVAVDARGTGSGSRRLVAWVVFNQEETAPPTFAELKAFLAEWLTDAMIPSAWMRLDDFPLTPSGKVDRRALPTPDIHTEDVVYQAPATPAEEMLAGIFSEVLGARRVGARDDFFDLGGHSLLATQVMSRLRDAFGIEVPLRRLFERPVVVDLARAVEEALAQGAPAADAPIPRTSRHGALPLSYAQERLWFLEQLQPGSTVYSLPLVLRLEGELDVPVLAAAFAGIVARHETLRTVFVDRGGEPVQVVRPAAGWSLPLLDLSGLPDKQQEAACIVKAWASVPFDLAHGPVVHTTLLRLGSREHRLLLNMHHIVSDGWSMGVLVRELEALYAAFKAGQPSHLPDLPVQYADFAVWQRSWLSGEVLERHVEYWRDRLAGLPGEIELPTDRPRPAVRSTRGAVHHFDLDARLAGAVTDLARREGATPFMVLTASLLTVLSRWSGQSDLAVGTPIANRNRVETEGLIGFFVNTLVLRGRLDRMPDFLALLRQVRETTLGAYAHQDLPFEKVIDELQPERDPSRTPFFQVMFALQNAPMPPAELEGLTLAPEEPESGNAKFDLTLGLIHAADGRLDAAIEYATDLFDRPTMVRFVETWRRLLEAAVANPGGRLDALPLLSKAQLHQVLGEWNDTRRAWEGDPALHELFERQADRQPEAIAGICGGSITYGELEARANQLAHHLRRLGVKRGQPVGLWMPRSLDLLAAVLGVLKSGAVYVPLDAGWPTERVETILAGTGTRILVTGPEPLPESGLMVVRLDDPALAEAPASRPEPVAGPDDLGYLIHTSGSTGAPKGIVVRHRSAVNTLRWNNETLEIGPGDRHLFVNSISFDLSIYDMLGMLGAGATIRVATEDELRDPERLAAILRDEGITTWNSAPSALQQLVTFFPPPGEGKALRRVFLAGDWIPLSLPDLVWKAFPNAVIGNFGGATETSVWSNWYRVDEVDPAWTGIPYGRPLANNRYYVLDAALNPCPPGVPGDNYIGGGCPAMGYAGQPDLTAERFLPDPYSDVPGARMYATGDRARFWPDGTMEFLGRVDFQVKVRGYRIELGEIEAALMRQPGVREAVALAREDVSGDKRLVAYVVPAAGAAPDGALDAEDLRAALYQTLPEYMVPWSYVFLDGLPVTANGKLDRQALPAPGAAGAGAVDYVAPRSELERAIAAVWRDVLEVERVGVHDNFFETGGSSLLIVKLHARLKEALGRDVPVMELFRYTTVDALARKLAEEPAAGAPPAQEAKAEEVRERAKTRQDALRQLRQTRSERKPR